MDPLKESLCVYDTVSTETGTEKYSNGILIFVHGSPCEGNLIKIYVNPILFSALIIVTLKISTEVQCQEMAYSLGKALQLPTINIDLCIVEALCVCTCPAKILITSAIEEMYAIYRKGASNKTGSEEDENVDESNICFILLYESFNNTPSCY